MKPSIKPSERLYNKYSYLADKYASRIFSYEELSFEYEDLLQEFRLKIFTSIKSYGRRWSKYRKGLAPKPVPLKYYLECACANKQKDFIKYIKRENHKLRIDAIDCDFGYDDETRIIPEKNVFVINGVDLLEGLVGKERIIFSLFLRGFTAKRFLTKVTDNNDDINVIDRQKKYLTEKYGNELLNKKQLFYTYKFQED